MNAPHRNPKKFTLGLGMLAAFVVILVLIFMPIFGGMNGLDYLDNLYNSISKESAYYIPQLRKDAAKFSGKPVDLTLKFEHANDVKRTALLYQGAGAQVTPTGNDLKVKGDLGKILAASLADADAMFHNKGEELQKRYPQQNEKAMLYTWWSSHRALEKALNRGKHFDQAKFVATVQAKAVEMAYNFYGIQPQSIGARWGIVVFSLLFYVVYTLWYGFGVMYIFEGSGFQLEH